MLISNYIMIYENALPDDICDGLIQQFDTMPVEDIKEDKEETEDKKLLIRQNLDLNLSIIPDFSKTLQPVLMNITKLVTDKYQAELPIRTFPKEIGCEVFRVKKYRGGPDSKDYFAYHVDVNSHSSARRYLALCWYLNDVTQGGETFFPHPNVRIKPKKGRLAMYPSLWNYPHSEEHPVSGDSYRLRTYLHYL